MVGSNKLINIEEVNRGSNTLFSISLLLGIKKVNDEIVNATNKGRDHAILNFVSYDEDEYKTEFEYIVNELNHLGYTVVGEYDENLFLYYLEIGGIVND